MLSMFKVIIAGSRKWTDYATLKEKCDIFLSEKLKSGEEVIIISGHATGADRLGELYAKEKKLKCNIIPANWDKYGKRAGMMRNETMAKMADACIVFFAADSENKGTTNMKYTALRHRIPVREVIEKRSKNKTNNMKIKLYRKKPVIVEVLQWTGDNLEDIKEFIGTGLIKDSDSSLIIKTLEGNIIASLNDFIIKGIQGEFYPCKPDIFKNTYEEVEEQTIKSKDVKKAKP